MTQDPQITIIACFFIAAILPIACMIACMIAFGDWHRKHTTWVIKIGKIACFIVFLVVSGNSQTDTGRAQDHEDRLRTVEKDISGIRGRQDRIEDRVARNEATLEDHEKRIRSNEEARIYMYAIIAVIVFLSNTLSNWMHTRVSSSKGRVIG